MTEFRGQDLTGAVFDEVDLREARFRQADLRGARFHTVFLRGAVFRGVWADDVEITGEIADLRVNGVDVMPFVEAELDRRHPQRSAMRPTDADGFREAWDVLEQLWAQTVTRARRLDPSRLHESVEGEWSFIETLRHLVFATDAWVRRVILLDPAPWHPLDLPWDEMPDTDGVPRDRDVRPSLDEVLALRAERQATVRQVMADLTDDGLSAMTVPVTEPGYPESESFPVREVLGGVLEEEWQHRLFAERDLDVLESRPAS